MAEANTGYCLFDTALGRCGIAWLGAGEGIAILAFQFPEVTEGATEAWLAEKTGRSAPIEPPHAVVAVIARIRLHLQGEPQDFRDVAVDLRGLTPFTRRVCEAIRQIPAGQTRSYGQLAANLGRPGAARAVGQALGRNPVPLIIPCHRVLAAGGKAGGFSAPGGIETKARLLAAEGAWE